MNKLTLFSIIAIIGIALTTAVQCRSFDIDMGAEDKEAIAPDAPLGTIHETPIVGEEREDEGEGEPNCICTMEFNPICASNSKTYENLCLFRCAAMTPLGKQINLSIQYYGMCIE